MGNDLFSAEVLNETWEIMCNDMPLALWETFYVTVAATFFAIVIGLPLGVLLVVGEKDGILPIPKPVMGADPKACHGLSERTDQRAALGSVPDINDSGVSSYPSDCGHDRRHNSVNRTACDRRVPVCSAARRKQPARGQSEYH